MRLDRLLRPRSIAAIGGLQAARVVEQCLALGYDGDIWPVHPTKTAVHGIPAFRSVAELPASPDAAFIGVNRYATIGMVEALRVRDCGGGVCFAAGFGESDSAGRALQAELLAAAGDMPLLGPNCYGYINYADGALLWPDQQGGRRLDAGARGVAIIAQSSNIAINFTMQQRGLPLAYVFTVGNQALVGISELALGLLDDPRVTTLGIYLEGLDSVEGFEQLAAKSRQLGKPVVLFNVGCSDQARAAALSHTASLVGSPVTTRAFINRLGFGRADSLPVFLEALKLLHLHGPLDSYRVSSMSCSGGEAAIIADAIAPRKLYFPPLDKNQQQRLQQVLGPLVAVANPLDYHTYCWANREVMEATYSALIANGYALNYLILDFPHPSRCDDSEWHIAVDAFEAALKNNAARGAFVIGMHENIRESYTEAFQARGIPCLYGIEEALRATEIAADIGVALARPPAAALLHPAASEVAVRMLDEFEAKAALAGYGVDIPAGGRAESVETALAIAETIGYPLAAKALGIAHKTEQDALRLNLGNAAELGAAAAELLTKADAILVEAMVEARVELLVGITRDPRFGLALTLGSGGILVELLGDSVTLLLPSTREQIEQSLRGLRVAALFAGYRGGPPADVEAALDAIVAIQEYALAQAHSLVELDVNPLRLGALGHGATAADVLIILEDT